MNNKNTATITLSLETIGTITFIVFLILKLTNTWDISWFWVWFPLWLPTAIILAIMLFGVIALTFVLLVQLLITGQHW